MRVYPTASLLILTCFLIVSGATQASGQADDPAVIGEYIQRNAELLERARELVSETNSVKARSSLETAVSLHKRSITLLANNNLARAALLAKHAREAISQTIALAKREVRLEAGAIKAIERATNRLDQARQMWNDNGDRDSTPTRKLLQESRKHLERAHHNMKEHLFEISLRLAMSSARLSTQAIAVMKRDFADPEAVRRELAKTNRALDRLAEQIGGDTGSAVERQYKDARDLQQKAQRSFLEQNFLIALEMTEQARKMAMRAMRLLAGSTSTENVEQAIRLTDMLIAQAKDIANERGTERLLKRIDQADGIQSDARRNLEAGRNERAIKLTLKAREMLKNALGAVRRPLDPEGIRETLVQTDGALDRLRDALDKSRDETARDIHARALSQQEKAWEEFRQDKLRAALAHTKLARRLTRRAIRLINDEEI